jgi:hypothetical protein
VRSRIIQGAVVVAVAAAGPALLAAGTPADVEEVSNAPAATRTVTDFNPTRVAAERRARAAQRSSRAKARRVATRKRRLALQRRRAALQRERAARRTRPPVTGPQHQPSADNLNWAALADCESSGNPRAIGGGGAYRGLYQFMMSTWHSVGGVGDPINASAGEQTYRAQLLYRRSGAGQWPRCGRRLFT